MAWRVANSLLQLRKQVNELYPQRSKAGDGTIGDAAHASRSSDHNPWVKDGDMGIVTGMDITHDPKNGIDSQHLAECLVQNRDPRLKYVISNRKIASFDHEAFKWRPYGGSNPHNHHVHISVKPAKASYDDAKEWNLSNIVRVSDAPKDMPHKDVPPMLKKGMGGPDVIRLQQLLFHTGTFDDRTEEAVKEFQRLHGLGADGVVGPYTWEKLGG